MEYKKKTNEFVGYIDRRKVKLGTIPKVVTLCVPRDREFYVGEIVSYSEHEFNVHLGSNQFEKVKVELINPDGMLFLSKY